MIYVDKTPLIHSLICRPGQYFLSRPRRFGKSLLVSLLKHLFLGHKDYFKQTWIAQNAAWQFKFHPVLIFDFNGISHDNPEQLTRMLAHAIGMYLKVFLVPLRIILLPNRLNFCLSQVYPNLAMFPFFQI
jgi:hypothetical protein